VFRACVCVCVCVYTSATAGVPRAFKSSHKYAYTVRDMSEVRVCVSQTDVKK